MSKETVDVLIVGAGASGAAIAYSLSDLGVKILCLEQGDSIYFFRIATHTHLPTGGGNGGQGSATATCLR